MNFMPAVLVYAEICGEELGKLLAAWGFIIYVIFDGFHLLEPVSRWAYNV